VGDLGEVEERVGGLLDVDRLKAKLDRLACHLAGCVMPALVEELPSMCAR
jgi:hypothetical protein